MVSIMLRQLERGSIIWIKKRTQLSMFRNHYPSGEAKEMVQLLENLHEL